MIVENEFFGWAFWHIVCDKRLVQYPPNEELNLAYIEADPNLKFSDFFSPQLEESASYGCHEAL